MTTVPSTLHHRLLALELLDGHDFDVLEDILSRERRLDAGTPVFGEGSRQSTARIVVDGWAIRFKSLPDGRRQILNYMLPGDLFGVYAVLFDTMEHGVEALTSLRMIEIPASSVLEAFRRSPRLGATLCWMVGQDERLLEEQIVRVGRRHAAERMAHLFVELHLRLRRCGMSPAESVQVPLTLPLLADTLGMSPIHAHRCFRTLERKRLIQRHNGLVTILDPSALAGFAGFDADYLDSATLPTNTRATLAR